ncbi:hypothetical protein [Streptomyces synnematoformans]|uniref:hypothetical protein n=1 Tax=Streptomyces synnematoformans TaxID=415721 RepID=UPI0031D05EC5
MRFPPRTANATAATTCSVVVATRIASGSARQRPLLPEAKSGYRASAGVMVAAAPAHGRAGEKHFPA